MTPEQKRIAREALQDFLSYYEAISTRELLNSRKFIFEVQRIGREHEVKIKYFCFSEFADEIRLFSSELCLTYLFKTAEGLQFISARKLYPFEVDFKPRLAG